MRQEHHLPKTMNYATLNIDDVMKITARLSTILVEESQLLGAMRLREVGPLKDEKEKLSAQLISFQKQLATDTSAVKQASENAREQLLTMTDDLTSHIQENMRRTVIAQNVNQKVMQVLTEAMAEQKRPNIYGRDGQANLGQQVTVSVNINEQA